MAQPSLDELEDLPPPEEAMPELESPQEPTPASKRRGARSSTSSRGSRSARGAQKPDRKTSSLEEIRTGVEDMFITTGTFCSPFLPVTGTVMISKAPKSADTVVRLCEQDPRVMKAMLRFIRYNTYFEAATVLGTLAVAVAVDVGQMSPEGFIPTKIIGKEIGLVYADRERAQVAAANGGGVPEPAWAGPQG